MQALLQHSDQTYGPLPSELGPRRVRSRTQSRASPYPSRPAQLEAPASPEPPRPPPELHRAFATTHALQAKLNAPDVYMPSAVPSPKRSPLPPAARNRYLHVPGTPGIYALPRPSVAYLWNELRHLIQAGNNFELVRGGTGQVF
jgi:hypothetical protein